MSTLSDSRDRVEVILGDTGNARYSTDQIDEAFKRILMEYANAYPNYATEELTYTAAGRTIDLDDDSGDPLPIIDVISVFYPYDSTDTDHDTHDAYYWYMIGGQPTLEIMGDNIPQVDDVVKIIYTTAHTMDGLESATTDTFPAAHLNILIVGASAVAALNRAAALSESVGSRSSDTNQLQVWGKAQYELFITLLDALRSFSARHPSHPGDSRWKLDTWDRDDSTLRGLF